MDGSEVVEKGRQRHGSWPPRRRAERNSWETRQEGLHAVEALAIAATQVETELIDAVRRARRDGCPWEQIAQRLGVSRQAAHQRFARWCDGPDATAGSAGRRLNPDDEA